MKHRFAIPASFVLASLAAADVHVMHANLDGGQEVPPVATAATGTAVITVDDVTGYVHVQGSAANLSSAIQAVHLHGLSGPGANSGPLFSLSFSGDEFEGSATLNSATVAGVLDGLSYVNVHTATFGGGEVRGQVTFEPLTIVGILDGAQAGNMSTATGTYIVDVDRNTGMVSIQGTYTGLGSPVTVAHLHGPAWFGAGGGPLVLINTTGGTSGTYTGGRVFTDVEMDHLLDGFTYVNIHTQMIMAGEVRGQVIGDTIGTPYCQPQPNSTGSPGVLRAVGSPRANDNDVTLEASDLSPNAFGYVIASQASGQTFPVAGSHGRICVVGPNIARFVSTIQSSGATGTMTASIDLTSIPGNPPRMARPGDVYNFQIWNREPGAIPTSNFTNAVSISFR